MLLGTRGVHVLTLRTWLERLEAHVRAGEFSAALRLAWSLYGERSAPLVGLQTSSGRRQAIIKERVRETGGARSHAAVVVRVRAGFMLYMSFIVASTLTAAVPGPQTSSFYIIIHWQ